MLVRIERDFNQMNLQIRGRHGMKAIKNKRSSGSGGIASELSVIASKENI